MQEVKFPAINNGQSLFSCLAANQVFIVEWVAKDRGRWCCCCCSFNKNKTRLNCSRACWSIEWKRAAPFVIHLLQFVSYKCKCGWTLGGKAGKWKRVSDVEESFILKRLRDISSFLAAINGVEGDASLQEIWKVLPSLYLMCACLAPLPGDGWTGRQSGMACNATDGAWVGARGC